jgi:sulfite reductase alpha subunit-like flavoprotein
LVERNGKVYVCGSSGNMPKGVRQAILEVLTGAVGAGGGEVSFLSSADEKGQGGVRTGAAAADAKKNMSVDEAEAFLVEMEKTGRYWQETW